MPNWCNNVIELTHSNPEMITRAVRSLERGEFLQEFIPCPKELTDTVSGYVGDEQAALDAKQAANVEKYGYPTWYEHNINEWGTKWDVSSAHISDQTDISVSASFDTAWAPPVAAMDKLSDLGFEVELYYYEPGMEFCGKYTTEYGDRDYKCSEEIPADIDEIFGITEQRDQWEEETEDE